MRLFTMILAGGTGEELSVLTRQRAKTALPFGGRYRIIDFCLSNCVHSGVGEIAVLAQYSPRSLIDHIRMGKPWDLDRRSGGVFILQPSLLGEVAQWYLGTAEALYQNIDVIRNSKAEHVLVLSGDQVYLMDYRRMAEYHRSHGRPVTIAIKEVHPSQRSRFGMVRHTKDGLISAFREKPASSNYRHASLGIYLFDREFLLDLLEPEKTDIVFDLVMPLLAKRRVAGYEFDGYWDDLGSVTSYYRASLRLLGQRSLIADSHWPIFTRGADLPPAKFAASSSVERSIIADGCTIEGDVANSILFPGVHIAKGTVVRDSIIFSFTKVGHGARINRAIIDKWVSAGAGSRIGTGRGTAARHRRTERGRGKQRRTPGITLVGKSVRISRGASIGAGEVIEPHFSVKRTDAS
ncbi:MAG: glucose-1-phosphate adenylyltransferase subunit GlgD [bacterium]|nr:MAG: glucose-1-phosphate adenylyltransferase subunit GlgD [bacterium]